jgi:hypothetical protein
MSNVLTAVDTIHKYVPNIPVDDPSIGQVNGYDTQVGAGDIEWTAADWQRFPNYIKKAICQLPANDPLQADIIDMEAEAATPAAVVEWIKGKHAVRQIAVVYASAANVPALYRAVAAAGELDQTYLYLANWNLDEQEAAALLGTTYEGFHVVQVQWASPTSNPNTLLPGTNFTLHDCGCDLNVTIPFPAWKNPPVHLVSVVSVATFSDGTKKSWTV